MAGMTYAEFQALAAYIQKQSGSSIRIVIYKSSDPSTALIGSLTGCSWSDNFEQLPVEESGEDGVNEIPTGRHSGTCSFNGFFTPERNDKLPTRGNFLEGGGVEYTAMMVVGAKRPGVDVPLNVFSGLKLERNAGQMGARGLVTFDLSGPYLRRYSGLEWSKVANAAN